MAGRTFEVDGLKVYGVSEGSGRPVLLLHGLGASSYSWRRLLPLLSRGRAVHALDWPGFGRSDKPSGFDYTGRGYSRFLVRALDALGLESADLVGNSMGGMIALLTALEAPRRVGRLALLGTPTYIGDHPPLLWTLRTPVLGRLLESVLGRWTVEVLARSCFVDRSLVTPELVEEYSRALGEPGGRAAVGRFIRGAVPDDAADLVRRYAQLPHSVLVLWGDHDNVVGRASVERFSREVPKARLVVVPDCGHAPQEEKPEAVFEALSGFLRDEA